MGCVTPGKRAGSRRAAAPARKLDRATLIICAGITACVIAWGYLVYAAIDFGTAARAGNGVAWVFMFLAALGAIACLFAGLLLIARLLAALGIRGEETSSTTPRPEGGKRAAR